METALILAALSVVVGATPAGDGSPDATIQLRHDPALGRTKITILAEGNRVAWGDVARGLARARGYDDSALDGVLPDRHVDITTKRWRRACLAVNLAVAPALYFETQQPAGQTPRLVITLDREGMAASEQRLKFLLRTALLLWHPDKEQYGLVLPDGFDKTPATQDLVVLVHGLHSSPERLEPLAAAIRGAGLLCAGFRYPNDRPIADSARLLADELKRLARQQPDRRVALVTSSMGALAGAGRSRTAIWILATCGS